MPRQLANRPRAHPPPHTLSRHRHAVVPEYQVLPEVSLGCPCAGGRLPTCYSAVRHFIRRPKSALTVRLACVRRAASVHPEPGSNSPFEGRLRRLQVRVWRAQGPAPGWNASNPSSDLFWISSGGCKITSKSAIDLPVFPISRSQYPVLKVLRAAELLFLCSAAPLREELLYAPPRLGATAGLEVHISYTIEREHPNGHIWNGAAPSQRQPRVVIGLTWQYVPRRAA